MDTMEALRKRMAEKLGGAGSTCKTSRQLKAHVSDVTVDSNPQDAGRGGGKLW